MIELNLLEKKEPLVLPNVLGLDLNELNLIMLFIAVLIWYLPQGIYESMNEEKIQADQKVLTDVKEKVSNLKKEIGKNGSIKEMLKGYQDQVTKLKERSLQVDEILKVRTNPKKILEKLARSVPEEVWFNSLKISRTGDVVLGGGAYSSRSLGEFITIINDSPYFSGSIIPSTQESKQEQLDGNLVNYEVFELRGKIKSFDMRAK